MCEGESGECCFCRYVGKRAVCVGVPILCFCTMQAKTHFLYWAKQGANTQVTEQPVLSAFGNLLQNDSVFVIFSEKQVVDCLLSGKGAF